MRLPRCPGCDYQPDDIVGGEAQPGTVSVCYNCAFVAIFDPEMQLREPSRQELSAVARDQRAMRIVRSIKNRGLLE